MKGKSSDVGSTGPTEQTQQTMDALVEDVLGASPDPVEEKPVTETAEEIKEKSLDSEAPEEEPKAEEPEEEEEQEEEEETTAEEDEEVVPKSKHKKTLDKMQKRIDELTQKIKQHEAKETKEPETQAERLEALSVTELEELSDNVDESLLDAKVQAKVDGIDVTEKVKELKSLKQSIKKTMRDAPIRFQKKQMNILEEVTKDVSEIDPDVVSRKGDLWNLATKIYASSPSLQKTVTGQGEAMRLAAEHLLSVRQFSQGKEKVSELSRKVNSLKKKTTLDTNVRKGNEKVLSANKLREKARHGTFDDKLEFMKSLVPDDYIQGS
jgi:hypothetical protein